MVVKVPLKSLLPVLIAIRCLQSLLMRTFFQADEFWQSLEPAHYMAFGYGELTWEWKFGLRSYAFPLIFQIGYTLVKYIAVLGCVVIQTAVDWFVLFVSTVIPNSDLGWQMVKEMRSFPLEIKEFIEYHGVIYVPKLIMGLLAAIGEYYTILLADKLYKLTMDKTGENTKDDKEHTRVVNLTLIFTISNFFNCFFITRTFINSFEMIMTSVALYYWDWTSGKNIQNADFMKSLIIGTFISLQRPTNAFIWIILGSFMIFSLVKAGSWITLIMLFRKVILATGLSTTLNICCDYYFYGYVTIPVLKFIKFNCTTPLSEFYGVAPWHFHLVQSLPIVSGYLLPLLLHSILCPLTTKRFVSSFGNPFHQFKTIIIINIALYSMIPHKEFRFIYPLQPFIVLLSVFDAVWVWKKLESKVVNLRQAWLKNSVYRILWILPAISMVISLILSTFHEAGSVSVIDYLHSLKRIDSLGFIMPCHSTPWQSHLHRNDIKDLWAITCDPPLHLLNDPDAHLKLPHYIDESDYLYDDIPKFIHEHFPPLTWKGYKRTSKRYSHEWPEYLVIFEHMDYSFMQEFLADSVYVESRRFFNTLSHWDNRRSGDIIVYHKIL